MSYYFDWRRFLSNISEQRDVKEENIVKLKKHDFYFEFTMSYRLL